MIISHSHKFIYFHAPKTAGTSVQNFLWSLCDQDIKAPYVAEVGYENLETKLYNHSNVAFIEKYYRDIYNEYFLIGNIRNPWDRQVSTYFFNKHLATIKVWMDNIKSEYPDYNENESFEYYIERNSKAARMASLVKFYNNTRLDFFIRFESLEQDLRSLLNLLQINKPLLLGHSKKVKWRKYTDYKKYYNQTTKKIVEEKYWDDIKAFGYTF